MKLTPCSPNELLSKAYQCQVNADELDIIIGHLNALQAELIDSFGTMGNHLEVDRLEIAVSRLTESAEHMRYVSSRLQELLTPIGPGSRLENLLL